VGHLGRRDHRGVLPVGLRTRPLVRRDMRISDALELLLAVGLLIYLVYVLIRPERF